VCAGRVGAGVAEAEVEGDQRPVLADGGGEDVGVGAADEPFVGDCVDVVAEGGQQGPGIDGDVLVEFELHVVGTSARTSCLASHAP
jgi:hypothetical protein